jgi:hypothetical protein
MRELDSPTPSALASCKHSFESHWTGLGARGDRAADLSDRCGTGLFLSVAHKVDRSARLFNGDGNTPGGEFRGPHPQIVIGSGDARNDVVHTQPRYELVVQVSFDCRGRAPPPALLGERGGPTSTYAGIASSSCSAAATRPRFSSVCLGRHVPFYRASTNSLTRRMSRHLSRGKTQLGRWFTAETPVEARI